MKTKTIKKITTIIITTILITLIFNACSLISNTKKIEKFEHDKKKIADNFYAQLTDQNRNFIEVPHPQMCPEQIQFEVTFEYTAPLNFANTVITLDGFEFYFTKYVTIFHMCLHDEQGREIHGYKTIKPQTTTKVYLRVFYRGITNIDDNFILKVANVRL